MTPPSEDLARVVTEIVTDYENWDDPFERDMLPEKQAIVGIDDPEERSRYLTLVVSIDYQRNAERLWQKTRKLWDEEQWIFRPEELVRRRDFDELVSLFEEHSMRFGKADAEIWYQNAETLCRQYDGSPLNLFEKHDFDAPSILNAVRSTSDFTYLGGEKIGPLWMRLIHEDVHSLSNITEIDIPVDTHIRRVTERLLNVDHSDEEIRSIWMEFCRDTGLDPVKVDQPLWLIGAHWDEWGEDYLESRMDTDLTAQKTESDTSIPQRSGYENDRQWLEDVAKAMDVEMDLLEKFLQQIADGR